MKSCDGCKHELVQNACCTIVRATRQEAKRIKRYTEDHNIEWRVNEGIKCGFLQEGQCSIYEVRPWTCRAFGVVSILPCQRFPEESVVPMTKQEVLNRRLDDPDNVFLGYYFEKNYYERMKQALKPEGLELAGV